MTPIARFRAGVAGIAILAAAGTGAYVAVEGVSWPDAFFMVMITISTVGFGEVFPLSTGGRSVTVAIMLLGVGLALYTAGAGIEQLFALGAGRRATRSLRLIRQLSHHVIVCGFGRVGRGVWESLRARGIDVVVIEGDSGNAEEARDLGALVMEGDATHNDDLLAAGVRSARALVACVTDDSDNLVIVLSARSLCPDLHLVARASEAESETKLRMAGADRVVAPQVVGSERMAAMAVESSLTDVFDVVVHGRTIEFAVEELTISPNSSVAGKSIRDSAIRQESGALILAVEDQERRLFSTPSPEHVLEGGTVVIVVGTQAQVDQAAQLLNP